ncbi:MAG: hypothetical protein HC934_07480 [Acaryochloridaceae cyanobacterium SU_2_1]|nr:hypothetical protein [Acaryochloridaceae cyanobacterium SU_2_1]
MTQLISAALDYEHRYQCPICSQGQLSPLALMEAFGCDSCRHIFTSNLPEQSICLADVAQPLSWRWTGKGWRPAHHPELDFSLGVWLLSVGLTLLPTGLIWLSYQLFPPLETSPGAGFPILWLAFVFVTHFSLTLLILAEYYQIPFYVAWKVRTEA